MEQEPGGEHSGSMVNVYPHTETQYVFSSFPIVPRAMMDALITGIGELPGVTYVASGVREGSVEVSVQDENDWDSVQPRVIDLMTMSHNS